MPIDARAERRHGIAATVLVVLAVTLGNTAAEAGGPEPAGQAKPGLQVTVYPLLARLPIFGASIEVPDLPDLPGSGVSGSTDVSLNGAYMFGGVVEGRRWFADAYGLWAALSASRSTPLTTVDSDTRFFNATAGVLIGKGLFAILATRRIGIDLDVSLTPQTRSSPLSANSSPRLWDPLLGVEYRGRLGRPLTLDAAFKGGGFGLGTDVDVSAEASVDWRIARYLAIRAGYSVVYFKLTVDNVQVGAARRTLVSTQTLHGPEIGFGIPF